MQTQRLRNPESEDRSDWKPHDEPESQDQVDLDPGESADLSLDSFLEGDYFPQSQPPPIGAKIHAGLGV